VRIVRCKNVPPDRIETFAVAEGTNLIPLTEFLRRVQYGWESYLLDCLSNDTLFAELYDFARQRRMTGRIVSAAEAIPLVPLAFVRSIRDFYAFETHVKTARQRRGQRVPAEWYEFPAFYYSYPGTIYGPEEVIPYPEYTEALDFELEVAAVIGKPGINIPVDEAEAYIAGYTIMNDWSARDVQAKEMVIGLGPAKSKDFATSLGPYLVSRDTITNWRSKKGFDLQMIARRNGEEISRGNWRDIHWSFAEMIARASQGVMLQPGDVIGSGTVGTGCILELGAENVGGWLQPGDVIELEIERMGVLRNTIGARYDPTAVEVVELGGTPAEADPVDEEELY
jgi:2-keto-4-pentenoate hydratase/2-oxohepta-3-ene-1,7-dioic acid hydratase in catechol pathway